MKTSFSRSSSFYPTFERKGENERNSHYCPGCGHGIIQKLIASVIDELEIQDQTIFLSPVGCSVFSYYYFDTGNVQCSHGRAPAVATGLKRALTDSIVISYQGDGDLAGIGMSEIIHAANRNENFTTIFVNNGIYGMTGGQMAPTTLIGQQTVTTPLGRERQKEGSPIRVSELLHALSDDLPIWRCSVASAADLVKTKRAIRLALQNQIEKRGFSFVEILSPCPTGWNLSATDSMKWIEKEMKQTFPLLSFTKKREASLRDKSEAKSSLYLIKDKEEIPLNPSFTLEGEYRIILGGFGGEGVLLAGQLLATSALIGSAEISYLPSYGPEMRGGSAHLHLTLSKRKIGSPLIDQPTTLIAFNAPTLTQFEHKVISGGSIIYNSTLISLVSKREDVHYIGIPATEIAQRCGFVSGANIAMACSYALSNSAIPLHILIQALPLILKRDSLLEKNLAIAEETAKFLGADDEQKSLNN